MAEAGNHQGYWLDFGDGVGWRRVTRAEYITAERVAGARRPNTGDEVATKSFRAGNIQWEGKLLPELRGTILDPSTSEFVQNLQVSTARQEAHNLRAELARAKEQIAHLESKLRKAIRRSQQNDLEVLRRAAPVLLTKLAEGMVREITAEIEKEKAGKSAD